MKYLSIIFALFCFSCWTIYENEQDQYCYYCTLELEAPDLELDENGYYHFQYHNGTPVFSLSAYVGYENEYVAWTTDLTYQDTPMINGSTYSNEEGYANTIMYTHEEHIGQIATIWAGYYDNHSNQWIDSIKVVIE